MRFKQYVTEMESITLAMDSEDLVDVINQQLEAELSQNFSSPESGFEKLREIVSGYGGEMPSLSDLDSEGDEIAIDVNEDLVLYVIYSLTEAGDYEFYAEITDDEGLEEIMSEEDDEEEKD
jgi:hypothetical protein